jgi:hypothetical protein
MIHALFDLYTIASGKELPFVFFDNFVKMRWRFWRQRLRLPRRN